MDRPAAPAVVARRRTSGTMCSDSPEATLIIGRALGAAARAATTIALVGPLGAGKTQLAKGVAEGLGVRSVVNSPTYILMNEHPGRLRLFHIDAYRLGEPEDAIAAGLLDERQADGVTVIEWADRLDGALPEDRLEIELVPDRDGAEGRQLHWTAHGDLHARLAAEALAP